MLEDAPAEDPAAPAAAPAPAAGPPAIPVVAVADNYEQVRMLTHTQIHVQQKLRVPIDSSF